MRTGGKLQCELKKRFVRQCRTNLKSNRRILVFLNMSLQGPALVSSVVVHKELLYVYSRGVSPSSFFYSADLWSKENIGMVDHDWW